MRYTGLFLNNKRDETTVDAYETGIKDLGGHEGFPVLILAPEFMRYAAEHRVYLHGGAHWNETGHRVAGDFAADMLCQTDR